MKVLIVDDEPRVLQALNRVLRHALPRDWEVSTAGSGQEALEQLADRGAVDVVVSDMRMPEMDGTGLLGAIRNRWPDTVRVVLSGHSDPEAAIRVASIAHQFFEKPLPVKDFVAALRQIEGVRSGPISGPLREVLGAVGDLPVAPAIYAELTAAVADPDVRPEDLAGIVRRDPALVAKVIQLAGSAFFNRGERADELRTAVGRLGVRAVAALAVSSSAFCIDPASGLTPDGLAAHALGAATAARQLVGDPALAEEAFIAALLADVGLSVLACWLPARVRDARAHALSRQCSLATAERELFGVSHAEVGAYVLGLWCLPQAIVDAVAAHHAEDPATLADRPVAHATHTVHATAGAID
jgi:HD-like signal output (HDOD) protein